MDGKDFILERVRINTSALFAEMLVLLEDIKHEHDRHFAMLLESAPESFAPVVRQANYLDDENMRWYRKRILDLGNGAIRKMFTELGAEPVHVEFRFKQ